MEQSKLFKSGLKLVVKKNEGIYSVSCGVFVGVGSSTENPQNNGYSHFIEHMLFKGTTTRTALQISEEIDNIGGELNAYTAKDVTCFYTRTLNQYAETSISLLSDLFFNATFDKNELEREKKVVIEEILMDQDQPDSVCHDLIATALYGEHSLGYNIVGTAENIKNSTRESLMDYKQKFYVPHNMCICFSGNIEFDDAVALVEKYFENNFTANQCKTEISKLSKAKTLSRFLSVDKDSEQSHISLAFESFPYDDEKVFTQNVASMIFGGGMSSRLFQTIREQNGLAYNVYSYPSLYTNNGYFEIYMGTSPKNIEKAVDLLKKEIAKIKETGITEIELNRAKAQLKGNLVIGHENSLSVMGSYGVYMLKTGKLYDMDKRLKSIDTVTLADVNEILNTILDENKCSVCYVGKPNENTKYLKNLISKN